MRSKRLGSLRQGWPGGWAVVRLAKAGQWLSGGTPNTSRDEYWGGDIPWISAASLKAFRVGESGRMVTSLGALNGTRLIPEGAVIFVVRGMSLNNEFRIGVTERRVAFGQDCKAIIAADGIDPVFLAYAVKVQSSRILGMVETTSHGTGRLDTRRLGDLEIGVPSLREQRRITAAISAVSHYIGMLEQRVPKLRSALVAAVEKELCGPSVRLGSILAASPRNGYSPVESLEWSGVSVLGLGCLTVDGFSPRHLKNVPEGDFLARKYVLRDGDLLISRANTRELVGLVGRYRDVGNVCIYPDLMIRLRPDESRCLTPYLELLLRSRSVRNSIQLQAQGTNESMVKVNAKLIGNLRISLPSVVEQERVIKLNDAFRHRIDELQRRIDKLRVIREALAEDLLSGRVRVTDL